MFYNKINKILSCKNCKEQLDEPKILPCGKTICSLCVSQIKVSRRKYVCLICENKHEMLESGLPINESILEKKCRLLKIQKLC